MVRVDVLIFMHENHKEILKMQDIQKKIKLFFSKKVRYLLTMFYFCPTKIFLTNGKSF